MTRYEATFEIESNADRRAAQRLVEEVYDALREELQGTNDEGAEETLEEFREIREATSARSAGTLTVCYESRPDPLED